MKRPLVKIGFWLLGRAMQAAAKIDPDVRKEIELWPEGFSLCLQVFGQNLAVSWVKQAGLLRFKGFGAEAEPNLCVILKNLQAAYKMVLGVLGVAKAYAQRRIAIKGNTVDAMIFTRIVNATEAYLFPRFITKRLLKQAPRFSPKQYWYNLLVYLRILV